MHEDGSSISNPTISPYYNPSLHNALSCIIPASEHAVSLLLWRLPIPLSHQNFPYQVSCLAKCLVSFLNYAVKYKEKNSKFHKYEECVQMSRYFPAIRPERTVW